MKTLASLFSSAAKFEILGLLRQRSNPLPLRHISYLTDLPIRSVEMAVKSLCKEKIVLKKKSGRLVLLSFNEQHALAALLKELFAVATKHLGSSQPNLDKKAQDVLAFIDSANALFHQAKVQ